MIGKVSMKCTRETFSEKQLQFLPYSLCTLEYSNSSTQRACLENLQVECSDVGGRVGMRKREKKKTQCFKEFLPCLCSENPMRLQCKSACMGNAQFMENETVCFNRGPMHGATPTDRSKVGVRRGDDRQSFIEIHS